MCNQHRWCKDSQMVCFFCFFFLLLSIFVASCVLSPFRVYVNMHVHALSTLLYCCYVNVFGCIKNKTITMVIGHIRRKLQLWSMRFVFHDKHVFYSVLIHIGRFCVSFSQFFCVRAFSKTQTDLIYFQSNDCLLLPTFPFPKKKPITFQGLVSRKPE